MKQKQKPYKLTKAERAVIEKVAKQTSMNSWFSLEKDERTGEDCVYDAVFHHQVNLRYGLKQLGEAIFPGYVRMSDEEYATYHKLMEKLDLPDPFIS